MRQHAELPDLSPGLQLLETDIRGAVPALVVDQLLQRSGAGSRGSDESRRGDGSGDSDESSGGDRSSRGERLYRSTNRALWADAHGHARTRAIADVAPDRRILRRIEVARGFTAYQHYAIVEALAERALADGAADGDGARSGGPALLVAPAIDAPYRDDGLRGDEGREMLVRALATLAGVARRREIPVLVTRTADDDLAAPVANAARETITCERTPMGPRFATDEFETLVYPAGDGLVQTTLAFWQRVLERRAPAGLCDAGTATASGDGASAPGRHGDESAATLESEPAATGQPAATDRPALVRGEPVATPTATDRVRTEVLARGAD